MVKGEYLISHVISYKKRKKWIIIPSENSLNAKSPVTILVIITIIKQIPRNPLMHTINNPFISGVNQKVITVYKNKVNSHWGICFKK